MPNGAAATATRALCTRAPVALSLLSLVRSGIGVRAGCPQGRLEVQGLGLYTGSLVLEGLSKFARDTYFHCGRISITSLQPTRTGYST